MPGAGLGWSSSAPSPVLTSGWKEGEGDSSRVGPACAEGGGSEPSPEVGGSNPPLPTPPPAQAGQTPEWTSLCFLPFLSWNGTGTGTVGCRAKGRGWRLTICLAGLASKWSLILYPPEPAVNVCWVGRVSLTHGAFWEAPWVRLGSCISVSAFSFQLQSTR